MSKFVLILFVMLSANDLFSQINYYVGFDLLSTTSKAFENDKKIIKPKLLNIYW